MIFGRWRYNKKLSKQQKVAIELKKIRDILDDIDEKIAILTMKKQTKTVKYTNLLFSKKNYSDLEASLKKQFDEVTEELRRMAA